MNEASSAEGEKAILDIVEDRYFVGFWFVDGDRVDWFAAVWRDKDQPWRAMYRFRYDPSVRKDGMKSVYALEAKSGSDEDEKKIMDAMNMAAEMTAQTHRTKFHYVDVRSDKVDVVMGKLLAQPWAQLAGLAPGGDA
jgi:hypothetical protein